TRDRPKSRCQSIGSLMVPHKSWHQSVDLHLPPKQTLSIATSRPTGTLTAWMAAQMLPAHLRAAGEVFAQCFQFELLRDLLDAHPLTPACQQKECFRLIDLDDHIRPVLVADGGELVLIGVEMIDLAIDVDLRDCPRRQTAATNLMGV